MNRRTRHIVVLSVAVITASIASLGVYRATASMPTSSKPSQLPVVVAARSLAIGAALTERDVKVVAWPAGSLVPGAIGNVKDVVNRGLLTAVLQNEPITTNKLADAHSGAGLPPAIPPGMRAMSVKVNDVIGVAGFIVPGSRVDVVVTMRRSQSSVTTTVASNVVVLTEGTRREQETPETDPTKTSASTVVTLMVTPQQAERIALAQSEGQIMLALRNPLDRELTVSTGVRTEALLADAPSPAPAPAPKAAAPRRVVTPTAAVEPAKPEPYRVDTLRGGKRTEEILKEAGKEGSKEPGKEVKQ